MRRYGHQIEFERKPSLFERCEDGVETDFRFGAYGEVLPAWRYPDHVVYIGDVVRTTVDREMREEARQMRAFHAARRALNEVVEGSDQDLDRIVRGLRGNGWRVSGKLEAEFPLLADERLATGRRKPSKRRSKKGDPSAHRRGSGRGLRKGIDPLPTTSRRTIPRSPIQPWAKRRNSSR